MRRRASSSGFVGSSDVLIIVKPKNATRGGSAAWADVAAPLTTHSAITTASGLSNLMRGRSHFAAMSRAPPARSDRTESFPYLNLTEPRTFLPGMPLAAYAALWAKVVASRNPFGDGSAGAILVS